MLNAHMEEVRTFVAVVDAGSVSAAARHLHLTQSAITRRVQRLERAVGAELIDRRRRPFGLTSTGVRAAEQCRRILSDITQLQALAADGGSRAVEARIGVAHALTELVLARSLDAVRRVCPTVRWRVSSGWSQELLARVQAGTLDAACVLLPADQRVPPGLQGHRVADDDIMVVASSREAARLRTPRDLAGHGWIVNPQGCAARARVERALARLGLPFAVDVEAYDYDLQMTLVARGRGLGLVPRHLLERSAVRSRLTPLRLGGFTFPFAVWAVTSDTAAHLAQPWLTVREALSADLREPGNTRRNASRAAAAGRAPSA